jgi:RHS repeat-associated protein
VLRALAEAKDTEAAAAEQQSIAATNAAIELREHAATATEAAADEFLLADAAQAEADHYLYLAENPPNTEQTTLFAYDPSGHLIGEYDETGTLIRDHVWLGDQPIAMLIAEATYNVQADHLNTPTSMMDMSGLLVWQASREPFGATTLTHAAVEQHLRFPGQYFDQETELHQNWNREYDPEEGRYIEADPTGLSAGLNLFVYVSARSTLWTDPTGLEAYSTIQCDGKGKLEVVNIDKNRCTTECTKAHEESHIQDWYTRYGPDFCRGKSKGYRPTVGAESAFLKMSECNAYRTNLSCLLKRKREDCTCEKDPYLLDDIAFVSKQINATCYGRP